MKQVVLDRFIIDHWEEHSNKKLFCKKCATPLIFKEVIQKHQDGFDINTGQEALDLDTLKQ